MSTYLQIYILTIIGEFGHFSETAHWRPLSAGVQPPIREIRFYSADLFRPAWLSVPQVPLFPRAVLGLLPVVGAGFIAATCVRRAPRHKSHLTKPPGWPSHFRHVSSIDVYVILCVSVFVCICVQLVCLSRFICLVARGCSCASSVMGHQRLMFKWRLPTCL
jgi:hypothetical protein